MLSSSSFQLSSQSANPWENDPNAITVDSESPISKFLQDINKAKPETINNSEEPPKSKLNSDISTVMSLLDEIKTLQIDFQENHALLNYSELLLAHSTQSKSKNAQKLSGLLQLISQDPNRLQTKLRKQSRKTYSNSLQLGQPHHGDFVKCMQHFATINSDALVNQKSIEAGGQPTTVIMQGQQRIEPIEIVDREIQTQVRLNEQAILRRDALKSQIIN